MADPAFDIHSPGIQMIHDFLTVGIIADPRRNKTGGDFPARENARDDRGIISHRIDGFLDCRAAVPRGCRQSNLVQIAMARIWQMAR